MSIRLERLAWVGTLTIAASVLAVALMKVAAVKALSPLPRFTHAVLTSREPETVTAVLVMCAVAVFAICARVIDDPVRAFRRIALGVLLISFVPNVGAALLMGPAADWPSMIALMLMHVVAWAISVSMLPTLTVAQPRDRD